MLRVRITDARPGMVLAELVAHPSVPRSVLLRAGAVLDERCVQRLADLGVRDVWIRYPGFEDLVKFADPRVLAASRELAEEVASALDGAIKSSRVELDFASCRRAVMGLLESLAANPHAALLVSEIVEGDRPFVRHSGNVCVLSLLMALKVEFYLVHERRRLSANAARDLSGLGVGAMLHDVGMTRLSPEALARWNQTRDERDPEWREHTQRGFEMLADQVEPAAAGVVLHHHQAVDGSGFPARVELGGRVHPLAGSEIHVFARLAAAADLFDRVRNPAHAPGASDAATPPIPAVRALATLLRSPLRRRIDPIVLRALVNVAPPYPPGSLVTITGGRKAAVVDWSPADPCRPTVEVIGDLAAPPRRGEPRRDRIDLRLERDVSVIEAEGQDVRHDNFSPSHPEEFDLARVGREMTLGSQNAA